MSWRSWAVLLAVLAGAALLALLVTSIQLRRTRRELQQLRASIRQQPRTGPVATTGRVVRAVVQGAARLRDEGLSGMLSGSLDELVQWARDDRAAIVRVAAPDGSVTFFFSDIQDSTALNERLGDQAWLSTLHAHNDIVRGHVESSGGHVVKTVGDGFMAVFGDPVAATDAACGIHRSLAAPRNRRLRHTPITVRIGIHAGPAVSRDGDYFGRNVALAARVAAHASGGQTLVTAAVHDALSDHPTVRTTPCGPVELKGIAEPVEIWTVAP